MSILSNNKILNMAVELCGALDKASDTALPQEISDVVKLHAKIAAGLAIIPLPAGDMVAAIANTWTMYVRINDKLGITFTDGKLKTVASGVLTNLATSYLARVALGTLFKFLPGIGTVTGAAINGILLYSLTMTAAYIYMKALVTWSEFEGKDLSDIDTDTHFSDIVDSILKEEKDEIKNVMSEAKGSFKKEDMSDAEALAKKAQNGEGEKNKIIDVESKTDVADVFEWVCPACGNTNTGKFCSECGVKKA